MTLAGIGATIAASYGVAAAILWLTAVYERGLGTTDADASEQGHGSDETGSDELDHPVDAQASTDS